MTSPDSPDALRRLFLRGCAVTPALAALAASGVLAPSRVLAAEWHKAAFTATNFNDALKAYGAQVSTESREITFNAPEIAENGAQVVIEISSNLPGSQTIAIFAQKNPMPLAANLSFSNGAQPQVRLPLKLAETTRLRAVVKTTDGKIWHAQREVKVTLGGCAG